MYVGNDPDALVSASGVIVHRNHPDPTSSIVPVELISFSAESIQGKVKLKWTTATELNNLGFEIERKFEKKENALRTKHRTEAETIRRKHDDELDVFHIKMKDACKIAVKDKKYPALKKFRKEGRKKVK